MSGAFPYLTDHPALQGHPLPAHRCRRFCVIYLKYILVLIESCFNRKPLSASCWPGGCLSPGGRAGRWAALGTQFSVISPPCSWHPIWRTPGLGMLPAQAGLGKGGPREAPLGAPTPDPPGRGPCRRDGAERGLWSGHEWAHVAICPGFAEGPPWGLPLPSGSSRSQGDSCSSRRRARESWWVGAPRGKRVGPWALPSGLSPGQGPARVSTLGGCRETAHRASGQAGKQGL